MGKGVGKDMQGWKRRTKDRQVEDWGGGRKDKMWEKKKAGGTVGGAGSRRGYASLLYELLVGGKR